MRTAEKFSKKPVSFEKRLEKVIIDDVNFNKVRFAEALTFVRTEVAARHRRPLWTPGRLRSPRCCPFTR